MSLRVWGLIKKHLRKWKNVSCYVQIATVSYTMSYTKRKRRPKPPWITLLQLCLQTLRPRTQPTLRSRHQTKTKFQVLCQMSKRSLLPDTPWVCRLWAAFPPHLLRVQVRELVQASRRVVASYVAGMPEQDPPPSPCCGCRCGSCCRPPKAWWPSSVGMRTLGPTRAMPSVSTTASWRRYADLELDWVCRAVCSFVADNWYPRGGLG